MKRLSLIIATLMAAPLSFAQTPLEAFHSAASIDAPTYTYDIQINNGDKDIYGIINPSAPMGERLTITSPAEDDWSKKFRKRAKTMRKHAEGNIWCQQFSHMVPEDADLISETDTTARYAFQPQQGDKSDDLSEIAEHLDGFITLEKTTGNIYAFEMISTKPFKPMVMAKINDFQLKVSCAPAPNGFMHIKHIETTMKGKAMAKSISQHETQTISNLQEITPAP